MIMNLTLVYGPALEVTDEAGAAEFFESLVVRHMRETNHPREKAEAIERYNLGYYLGYFDTATRARLEPLFKCRHPIFGSIAENGPPSLEEAFLAGVERGLLQRDKGTPGNE